jgi:hypothetical protein
MANEALHFKELLRQTDESSRHDSAPRSVAKYDDAGRLVGTFESYDAIPRHAERRQPPPPQEK